MLNVFSIQDNWRVVVFKGKTTSTSSDVPTPAPSFLGVICPCVSDSAAHCFDQVYPEDKILKQGQNIDCLNKC